METFFDKQSETMAEEKNELKNEEQLQEEQLQEEQLDEVNGGAFGKKYDMLLTPEDLPDIPDPLTVDPVPLDPEIVQKIYQRIRKH